MADITNQPVTPAGRLFLQPLMDQVINCAIACHDPFDIDAIRTQLQASVFLHHPRFRSLVVKDSHGRERWKTVEVNIDRHLIVHHEPLSTDSSASDEDVINDHIADLAVSSPLPMDKPLWEVHLFLAHNTAVCRFHHALGDGVSLMSALLSCCRRVDDSLKMPTVGGVGRAATQGRRWSVWTLFKVVWFSLIYSLQLFFRGLWITDENTILHGRSGLELWPRKLATARFKISDMKIVKGAVAGATINDVLFAIYSSGLSRYLDMVTPKEKSQVLREGLQLTGVAFVNLRPQPGVHDVSKLIETSSGTRWGNKLGIFLLPIYYHRRVSDPIQFVKRAKQMTERKKLSFEASLSYTIGLLILYIFGAKLCTLFNYRIGCNTTLSVSNILGPREEITFAGNAVKYIRVTSSSSPHALTMHMVSYAGIADMQILAAEEVIPDPKILAKCFEEALLEMKEAAVAATSSSKEVHIPIESSLD